MLFFCIMCKILKINELNFIIDMQKYENISILAFYQITRSDFFLGMYNVIEIREK